MPVKQHELILEIITIEDSRLTYPYCGAAALKFRSVQVFNWLVSTSTYLLVIKNNFSEIRHIFSEDSVASRVVAVFVTCEGLRKSSDILDTSGNNQQGNQTSGPHPD